MKTLKILANIVITVLISTVLVLVITSSLNIPDVHVSHSTGNCVEVLNHNSEDNYTCENLPAKYSKVWVK